MSLSGKEFTARLIPCPQSDILIVVAAAENLGHVWWGCIVVCVECVCEAG